MNGYKLFLDNARHLFGLAGKADNIEEMERNDKMAHVQLKLAHDAARANELKANPPANKWWDQISKVVPPTERSRFTRRD